MAIPSGAGTEVLKRNALNITASDGDSKIIDGVANHIYTVLTLTIYNHHGTDAATITMYVSESASTTRFILNDAQVPSKSTFVWNDKFVMVGTDELLINTNKDTGYFYVSYIDQDWS